MVVQQCNSLFDDSITKGIEDLTLECLSEKLMKPDDKHSDRILKRERGNRLQLLFVCIKVINFQGFYPMYKK